MSIYGYKNNNDFIDKAYELLEKLGKEEVWDKDTLVIGLDKSVRPLAYTLKKISDLEKRKTPDIRFFNFSRTNFLDEWENEDVSKYLKEKLNPQKLFRYKKVLILDEHVYSGRSLNDARVIFNDYFKSLKNPPEIKIAVLGKISENNIIDNLIYLKNENPRKTSSYHTGITDKPKEETDSESPLQESIRWDGKIRDVFLERRNQLSKDIKNYVHKRKGYSKEINHGLEGIIKLFSFLVLILGILLGSFSITGRFVGEITNVNLIGSLLVVLGILGLVLSRK